MLRAGLLRAFFATRKVSSSRFLLRWRLVGPSLYRVRSFVDLLGSISLSLCPEFLNLVPLVFLASSAMRCGASCLLFVVVLLLGW